MTKALILALWLSTAADYSSGFRSGREVNPFLGQSKVQQGVVMSVGSGLTYLAARALDKRGHKTAAKVVMLIGAGSHSVAAIHNLTLGVR